MGRPPRELSALCSSPVGEDGTKQFDTVVRENGHLQAAWPALSCAHMMPVVASRHAKYSVGFLKGCMAGVVTLSQGGFHFLFSFSP